jgi:alcohol dehydrogenase (cytochrome c)
MRIGHLIAAISCVVPLSSGALVTAQVFTGETNGRFSAFDAGTGKTLWVHETGGNVGAPPISYTVNGRQFVAVATGPASGAGTARSGSIRAFALP